LSGRYLGVEILPLSFSEFLHFKSEKINSPYQLITKKSRVEKLFEEFMTYGGFPQVVLTDDISLKEAELKSYFDSILLRDIVARYNLNDFRSLEKLSILLLSSIANPVSLNKIKNRLAVSFEMTNRYVEYLENSYMIQTIPLFDWSLQKQFTNPRKVYSIDTGLSKRVSFEVGQRLGDLLENIVYLELKRRFEEIYYFKTAQNYEVDFLIKEREKITHLIQVSWSLEDKKTKKRELRALAKSAVELKQTMNIRLMLLTMDASSHEEVDGVEVEILNIFEWLLMKKDYHL